MLSLRSQEGADQASDMAQGAAKDASDAMQSTAKDVSEQAVPMAKQVPLSCCKHCDAPHVQRRKESHG